ncbi:MAG: alanine racemase [Sphingomonadaceae bacterium]
MDVSNGGTGEAGGAAWPCWVEVDLDAIRHNVAEIRGLLPQSCQVMAVVKSQAYGHGAVAVAGAALEAGATWLAVARVREGVELRKAGIGAPILLLGPVAPPEIPAMVEHEIRPVLVSFEQAAAISRAAVVAGKRLPVHLKLETGMGRYGVPLADLLELLPRVAGLPGLELEGLCSHFATADEADESYARSQLAAFQEGRRRLEQAGFHASVVHMAASAAALGLGVSHLDMVRIGLSLYGLYPAPHLAGRTALRPALSVHSWVARVFRLEPGQSAGYGRTFVASEPTTAALVPMGYADGLPRCHSNRGCVLVQGQRAAIIGRVSMDQCVVDVSHCGPVREGDPVVVIGSQGDDTISCDEFAERSGTISYEALTSLGERMPRVYRSGGRVVGVAYLDEGRLEWCQR